MTTRRKHIVKTRLGDDAYSAFLRFPGRDDDERLNFALGIAHEWLKVKARERTQPQDVSRDTPRPLVVVPDFIKTPRGAA